MKWLLASAVAVFVLICAPMAFAAPREASSPAPSGNVQFQVTIPPTHSSSPTPTPTTSSGGGSEPASTGTPVLQVLVLGGGIVVVGGVLIFASRLVRPTGGRRA